MSLIHILKVFSTSMFKLTHQVLVLCVRAVAHNDFQTRMVLTMDEQMKGSRLVGI